MAVRLGSNAPVGLSRERLLRSTARVVSQPAAWTRPADWVAFTTPTSAEQKVIGVVAVYDQDSNYIALACTVTGGYTVDWGDGTSTTHTSAATAQKNYVFGDLSAGTLSSRGYRQAVITVTPTTGGATFSAINLNRRHSATPNTTNITNPWLDVAVAAPNATTVEFSNSSGGTRTSSMYLCEQVTIVAHNTTNMASMFRDFRVLQSVPLFNTASVTSMSAMFYDCHSLQSVPLFNTASVTSMSAMFYHCYSLQTVPLFNTASATNMSNMFEGCLSLQTVPLFNTASVTGMTNMFEGCLSLQTVPLFNTASVTGMTNMFLDCYSLQTVPLFNTASVTNMSNMFDSCRSLQTVPLFNTASVTNMTSMFGNCYSLQSVPLFNTASVTNMSNMFSGCVSLQTVPLFNTASATNMSSMFSGCVSLQTVPLFNTASVTSMSSMFNNCYSLESVPLFNTASVTSMSSMFLDCNSLQTVPLFNTASVTSMSSMFNNCYSLQNIPELNLTKVSTSSNNAMGFGNATATSATSNLGQAKLTGNRWTQTFQNCKMGAAQLNEMYTALAVLNPNVTNVTAAAGVVTYTVDDIRAFVAARTVTITGVNPVAYNLTSVTVGTVTAGAGTTGTFTVTNAATGAYVSGGVASITDNRTITVTSNPGVSGDDTTIATNKGWTVTG
jgi:surface protein